MRMQSSQANCGPTALHNALFALGIKRSLEECEILCGTTATDGTYALVLVSAINTIRGCNPVIMNDRSVPLAMYRLLDALRQGRSAILCTDRNEHYICAIGLLGKRIIIADSADNELVSGVRQSVLSTRWGPDYWGVIL